eukprot:SAG31_NODE_3755_length_3913_cov_37.088883_1_plen_83_part_00
MPRSAHAQVSQPADGAAAAAGAPPVALARAAEMVGSRPPRTGENCHPPQSCQPRRGPMAIHTLRALPQAASSLIGQVVSSWE